MLSVLLRTSSGFAGSDRLQQKQRIHIQHKIPETNSPPLFASLFLRGRIIHSNPSTRRPGACQRRGSMRSVTSKNRSSRDCPPWPGTWPATATVCQTTTPSICRPGHSRLNWVQKVGRTSPCRTLPASTSTLEYSHTSRTTPRRLVRLLVDER